ncbi:putative harbinger transposase-derived protein [Helianthus annuus]|nr:putative harbinger transposase-derived protein [Helianthus annuus]KAJ0554740.1 putative harbinger transposase-derived protein [Helianthus annuus]KAJ0720306.1 putative harbinger transposase-derived protein [Helianthus annuus]KAJ0723521.1 putative harbinger transposase-derived protein [Helianthus annuus]KAJ0899315.1 putative harbinger transposase-derived protein [Helianthus annuus]
MAFNSWWSSSSSGEEEMFFANAVIKAAQILMEQEEEEEDVSSESVITRRIRINRDRQAHEKLVNDYFSDAALYNADIFRQRFRMSRRLFTQIADDLAGLDPFFKQRPDTQNYEGFTTLQKCTAAIRQLAYETVADPLDEYLQMSARTTRECLYRFCHNVVKLYSKQYLRKPNAYDVQQLYQAHEARHGFPEMLGSIDCMHWAWHNCPNAWRGQYTRGDHDHPTLILEAVASQDLWIDAGIILLTEYIRFGLQLSRLFHFPRTKKGKNSPSVKNLQEKTSNVVLVFYKKKVPSFNNRHVRSHRRGCAFVCTLAFCSIT